jgi:hypothetical protein
MDENKAERLLDQAIHLGDQQATELARLSLEVRRLRRVMHRAIAMAGRGRIRDAVIILEEGLKCM